MTTKTKLFTADQFTPTEYKTAKDKAKFANHFADFVLTGCSWNKFPKWFYTQLSMCFGHIAEFNREGFYSVWFADINKRLHFINHCIVFPCYGEPEYTYCDVEKALIKWLKEGVLLF